MPSAAKEVSATVSIIAGNDECPFAIKGAGHAPQAGAANIVSHALETMPHPSMRMSTKSSLRGVLLLKSFLELQFLSGKTHSDNIIMQESGVTIDMTGISSVTVNADKTVASIGAGASWLDVYLYLDGLGVAVAGGRNAAVGVGGLTLGGWSFLSPELDLVLTWLQ